MFKKFFVAIMVMILMVSMTSYAKEHKLNGEKLFEIVKEEMKEYDHGDLKYEKSESKNGDWVIIKVDANDHYNFYIHYYFFNNSVYVYAREASLWTKVYFDSNEINDEWYEDVYNGDKSLIDELRKKIY
jgi:hypothetical protein